MSLKIIFTKKYVTDESGTLAIKSIVNRKISQKSMKIRINQNHFKLYFSEQLKGFKKKPYYNHNEINNRIKEELNKFGVDVDADTIDNSKKSYIEWYKTRFELIFDPYTNLKYSDFFRKLNKSLLSTKKTNLLFLNITNDWVELFFYWLRKNGLSSNTAGDYISLFRRMITLERNSSKTHTQLSTKSIQQIKKSF